MLEVNGRISAASVSMSPSFTMVEQFVMMSISNGTIIMRKQQAKTAGPAPGNFSREKAKAARMVVNMVRGHADHRHEQPS